MFITLCRSFSKMIHRYDAAQQCAGSILPARQIGGRRMEWTMEIAGIVMLGSFALYLLQQIVDSVR
jgi:hypothetical protein